MWGAFASQVWGLWCAAGCGGASRGANPGCLAAGSWSVVAALLRVVSCRRFRCCRGGWSIEYRIPDIAGVSACATTLSRMLSWGSAHVTTLSRMLRHRAAAVGDRHPDCCVLWHATVCGRCSRRSGVACAMARTSPYAWEIAWTWRCRAFGRPAWAAARSRGRGWRGYRDVGGHGCGGVAGRGVVVGMALVAAQSGGVG